MTHIRMALTGNPNSGKTTIFNALTGARRQVGNYPGITVEKHEVCMRIAAHEVTLVDLPGTYSLSAYSQEEAVVRQVLTDEPPDIIINICNAGALERNLYFAVQLMEMGQPLVLALNMMDEARRNGLHIDADLLATRLGVPVLPCVGRTGDGVQAVLECAVERAQHIIHNAHPPSHIQFSYGGDIDPVLHDMADNIEKAQFLTKIYPSRWIALKYLEGDSLIREMGQKHDAALAYTLEEQVTRLSKHVADTLDTSLDGIIADYRHGFITAVLRSGVVKRDPKHEPRSRITTILDAVLMNRVVGPMIMLIVLWLTYFLTLKVGEIPKIWLESFFGWLGAYVSAHMAEGLLRSLIVSGMIDGVGSIVGFVPLIFILFMIIAVLDDTGYMARIAHMLDRVFRTFGLHGCSVMPYIVSGGIPGGCAVPGILATRTLRSPRERLATMLTTSFLACGAKVPVFLLLVGVFFPAAHQSLILFGLTLVGWAAALLMALLLRRTVLSGAPTPFVLELPPYRMPTLRGIFIHAWERTWMYLRKAGTVILAISVLLWAGMTFPSLPQERVDAYNAVRAELEHSPTSPENKQAELVLIKGKEGEEALRHSFAGRVGMAFEPIGQFAGFDWRINISLLAGIAAKEVVVSTLGTAYSLSDVNAETADQTLGQRLAADTQWNTARAMALMLFVLLYSPCFVSVVVLKQEANSWLWALLPVISNTLLAYVVAVATYQVMTLF